MCSPQQGKGFHQRTDGVLLFADTPKEAPIVQFGGPLTLTILDWNKPLQPHWLMRLRDTELSILVGTPVFGSKHEAFATVYQPFHRLAFDDKEQNCFPVVEVEFPGDDPGAKPTSATAKVRY